MATITSAGSGNWGTAGTWDAGVPADNDTVIIAAGHTVVMNADTSGFANGIAGLTITSHASTPGMLACPTTAGAYVLKIKTGTTIAGTNAAVYGRILANSDGVWGNTGVVPANITFLISLITTASINAQYLDVALRCTEPTIKSVATFGTKLTVSSIATATDIVTMASAHGWSAGTALMVQSSGTLPGGLSATAVYYARSVSGADLKLALTNSDATVVDITSSGSGTIEIYSGYTTAVGATVNVLEDVTGVAQWASGAHVVLVNTNVGSTYDQQRVTLNGAPSSTQITLSASVDSAHLPGAHIWLMTRNVAIHSSCVTAVNIVAYATGSTHGGVFACEIRSTAGAGVGVTTFYGTGINAGSGHTISGTVSGCGNGINAGYGHAISGTVSGCTAGFNAGSGHAISGTVSGCGNGFQAGSGHAISGTVSGCTNGISNGSGHAISGTVSGCTNGISAGSGHTISGTVSGCTNGISAGSGHAISGTVSNNTTDFRFQTALGELVTGIGVVLRSATTTNPPTFANRNVASYDGNQWVKCENYNGVLGAHYTFFTFGDALRNTTTVRDGGADNSIEVIPSSLCATHRIIPFLDWTEHDVPASAQTRGIYVRADSAFAGYPTADQLWFQAEHLNHATALTTAVVKSTAVLSDGSTWVKLSVTFTPAQAGIVRYRAFLGWFETAHKIFVDNQLQTS